MGLFGPTKLEVEQSLQIDRLKKLARKYKVQAEMARRSEVKARRAALEANADFFIVCKAMQEKAQILS